MDDCVFCKMVAGEIAPDKLYEDEDILAFGDLNPQAPLHALIIPKRHIATVNDLEVEDAELIGRLTLVAKRISGEAGVAESGYRIVLNCNAGAGQSVFHLHLHLLGGRRLGWPPG